MLYKLKNARFSGAGYIYENVSNSKREISKYKKQVALRLYFAVPSSRDLAPCLGSYTRVLAFCQWRASLGAFALWPYVRNCACSRNPSRLLRDRSHAEFCTLNMSSWRERRPVAFANLIAAFTASRLGDHLLSSPSRLGPDHPPRKKDVSPQRVVVMCRSMSLLSIFHLGQVKRKCWTVSLTAPQRQLLVSLAPILARYELSLEIDVLS